MFWKVVPPLVDRHRSTPLSRADSALFGSTSKPASYHICPPPLVAFGQPPACTPLPVARCTQVSPPSSVRHTPRTPLVAEFEPIAYTVSWLVGASESSMRPSTLPAGFPSPVPAGQPLLSRVQSPVAGQPVAGQFTRYTPLAPTLARSGCTVVGLPRVPTEANTLTTPAPRSCTIRPVMSWRWVLKALV